MSSTMPAELLSLGWAAIDWIEHFLVHGPGDVEGERIELDDEFVAFIVKAYRVAPRTGVRIVRRAFLSRAKGRSKSGLAAMIECFEALGPCRFDHWAVAGEVSDWGYRYEPGEPVGHPLKHVEALNVATEEKQAGNTYDAVYYMLSPDTCAPELLHTYGQIDVGLTRINLPGKRGFIEPVTSSDSSKDGAKSTFIVADETHLWMLPRLHNLHGTMTRNLLKRKIASGWMLETSTMYAAGEGSVAEGTHAYAMSKVRSRDRLLFDHRQASDHWNLAKRGERIKALREAYGPAASWMDLASIADAWDDPQVTEADFRRFWLNQPVSLVIVTDSAIPTASYLATMRDEDPTPRALGVAIDKERAYASIAAATADHVGAVHRDRLGPWFVDEVVRIATQYSIPVAVDGKGPVGETAIDEIERAGVRVIRGGLEDYIVAVADLYDGIVNGSITHGDHDELNASVKVATFRDVGGGDRRVWSRKNGDVTMLEAATWARWAAEHFAYNVLDSIL